MSETVAINEAIMNNVANSVREELSGKGKKHDEKNCSVCNIYGSLLGHVEPVSLLFEVAMNEKPHVALVKLISIYILIGIRYSQALREVEELKELERKVRGG